LSPARLHLHVLGRGNVGSSLLGILAERAGAIAAREGVELRVAGVSGRDETFFDAAGLDSRAWRAGPRRPTDLPAILDDLARLERPVLVDCTASEGMDRAYVAALERGIGVVTANKSPFVVAPERHAAIFAAARRSGRRVFYETTVGADLPVLAPIADRIRSGDTIRLIEGSLSGTLGFLADAVSRGENLAAAVAEARTRGYTEPDPAEDLSGRDVARKALILAREIGVGATLEEVELEPFVPQATLDAARDVGLERALADAAPLFAARADRLRKEGRLIRYLAQIQPLSQVPVRVGPVVVDAAHPAAQLRGTEAFVAIHSERAGDVTIVVRGPGAGGPATASGLLADVLRSAG
jgi:aspartokinase/homoserine dehydrogenase 1